MTRKARITAIKFGEIELRMIRSCRDGCGRVFNLLDDKDAEEWYYGHDCE